MKYTFFILVQSPKNDLQKFGTYYFVRHAQNFVPLHLQRDIDVVRSGRHWARPIRTKTDVPRGHQRAGVGQSKLLPEIAAGKKYK